MIPRIPFGRTGHDSSRVIFGAAALGAMRQDRADRILDLLLQFGIDHIDSAASPPLGAACAFRGEFELDLNPVSPPRRIQCRGCRTAASVEHRRNSWFLGASEK